MNNFVKQLSLFVITIILVFLGAFSVAEAATTDPLSVSFSQNPLFNQQSFLPGDNSDSYFTATNTTQSNEALYVKFVQTGNGNLGDVINMEVKGNNFDKTQTLSQWFTDGSTQLSSLSPNAHEKYDLSANFIKTTGNAYENSTVNFDVCVGIGDGGVACTGDGGTGTGTSRTNRGGGGGNTGGDSGSKVLKGNRSPGVAGSTDENTQTGTNTPTNTPIISAGNITGNNRTLGNNGGPGNTPGANTNLANAGPATPENSVSANNASKNLNPQNANANNNLASALTGLPALLRAHVKCIAIFLIILLVIWLLTIVYDGQRKAKDLPDYPRRVNRFSFINMLLAVAFLGAVIIPVPCIIVALAIVTGLSEAWTLYLHQKLKA
jgi:hypothetical protein